MTSKNLGTGLGALVLFSAVALVGCTLTGPPGSRLKDSASTPVIGGGDAIGAKRIVLRMMVAARPRGDVGLGETLWNVADEQALEPEARRVLQANGFRFGRVSGELPKEVQDVLSAPPPRKIDAQTIILPFETSTLLDPGTVQNADLTLMLGQKDKVVGKNYGSARGFIRVTASFEGEDGVALRLVPELHHGPVQKGWSVAPGATSITPGQIIAREGQKEESFRDLAASLVLRPGQVAVLGGRHEKRGSFGDFLFGSSEKDGDQPLEKVIFLWAGRSDAQSADLGPLPLPGMTPIDPEK
jgi:hypothetical protein